MIKSHRAFMASMVVVAGAATAVSAGDASDLLPGQAPLIFVQGKLNAALLDGTIATTDEIYLWVPALDANGDVDLAATGQFFRIWDSGSTNGSPNDFLLGGNDDEDNEMRGMDFDPADGGSFLVSYDDGTTTGFVVETAIPDGNLVRVTPTAPFVNGHMQGFMLESLLIEGTNGVAGNMSTADLYGFAIAPDGSFYWASSSTTLATTTGGTVSKASNAFVHTEGFGSPVGSPRNIGDTIFYDGNETPPGKVFPSFINGQGRGVDVLADGGVLISVSGDYNYPNATDTGVDIVLDRWDIGLFNPVDFSIDLWYPGELFFQTIDTLNAEMLDFDVFDTQEELQAFQAMIGADSDAGAALAPFLAAAACIVDLNGDGVVDFFDVSDFLVLFAAGDPAIDFNGDGVIDVFDVFEFLVLFAAGCP